MSSGSLVVVGTGIRGIGQLTFEAAGWIQQADHVAYCVSDPVTEVWIQEHSKSSQDLYALYGNDKPRRETYQQMVAALVQPAREGQTVCGVLYGHPGVFADPPHEAIKVLRAEGIPAMMLPGVSAVDCLFADLGIDPGTVGCQEVEATELLLSSPPAHRLTRGDLAGRLRRRPGVPLRWLRQRRQPSSTRRIPGEVLSLGTPGHPLLCRPVLRVRAAHSHTRAP
ncbi:hypothetical protein GCM10022245_44920 [Streptomyces mayteni]